MVDEPSHRSCVNFQVCLHPLGVLEPLLHYFICGYKKEEANCLVIEGCAGLPQTGSRFPPYN